MIFMGMLLFLVENEFLMEKGVREILRLFISGVSGIIFVFLNYYYGSRGLYNGIRDVSGVSLFVFIGLN